MGGRVCTKFARVWVFSTIDRQGTLCAGLFIGVGIRVKGSEVSPRREVVLVSILDVRGWSDCSLAVWEDNNCLLLINF